MLYLHYLKRYKLLKKSLQTRADRQLDASTLFLLSPLPPLLAMSPARSSMLGRMKVLVEKKILPRYIVTLRTRNVILKF